MIDCEKSEYGGTLVGMVDNRICFLRAVKVFWDSKDSGNPVCDDKIIKICI